MSNFAFSELMGFSGSSLFGSDKQADKTVQAAQAAEVTGEQEYALVKRGELVATELERADRQVVECQVRWGRTVISLQHLDFKSELKGSVVLGEGAHAITMPEEVLGQRSFTLLSGREIRLPQNVAVRGFVKKGEVRTELADLIAVGTKSIVIAADTHVQLELGTGEQVFTISVSSSHAGRKPIGKNKFARGAMALFLGSALLHGAVVSAMSVSPGDSLDEENAPLDTGTTAQLRRLQSNAAERERKEEETPKEASSGESGSAASAKHKNPEGKSGTPMAKVTDGAMAVAGTAETKEVRLARTRAMIDTGRYGAIGALASVFGSSGPTDLTSGLDESIGSRLTSAEGHLHDGNPGDTFGYNGLGMKDFGPGGDGFSDGLGLDKIGDRGGFGHCKAGDDCKDGPGYSTMTGKTPMTRKPPVGKIFDTLEPTMNGGLAREVIRRIVRANFPRIRACYDTATRKNPEMKGTVTTRFIVDTTGAVETASLQSGTADAALNTCVVSVFATMSFPEPEGGKALVSYPISLDHD